MIFWMSYESISKTHVGGVSLGNPKNQYRIIQICNFARSISQKLYVEHQLNIVGKLLPTTLYVLRVQNGGISEINDFTKGIFRYE